MTFRPAKIYPITDAVLSGSSHADQVRSLAGAGARLIQLRSKGVPDSELFFDYLEAARIGREHGSTIIVNDRVDIAIAVGADGVHLGQTDLPPRAARALLGDSAVIGYSTHSVEQAVRAADEPIDYIAIGPIFSTLTKADHSPVIGLEGIRSVRSAIGEFPLVAIGGISLSNLRSVLDAGADSAAIISDLFRSEGGAGRRFAELAETAEK